MWVLPVEEASRVISAPPSIFIFVLVKLVVSLERYISTLVSSIFSISALLADLADFTSNLASSIRVCPFKTVFDEGEEEFTDEFIRPLINSCIVPLL
ncbi:MAG: hypothetical protein BWY32_03476 [bacterium ADurb.Bin243]|nr:MAG: hypothetical protein BWY32_03476 [bacterium ADurb.Bin243]